MKAGDVGLIKLREGKAVILPAETMIMLPENSRLRHVVLQYIQRQDGRVHYTNIPITDED